MAYRYAHLNDEEEYDPPRMPGSTRPTRRCTTTVSVAHPLGLYYPNYRAAHNIQNLSRPLPTSNYRDISLDTLFDDAKKAKLDAVLDGTGIVYMGAGGPGKYDGTQKWDQSDVASWWLLEHNGKLVGVTALHSFRMDTPLPFHVYVDPSLDGNLKNDRSAFHRQDADIANFIEVQLRTDLLDIREKYIRDLHNSRDPTKIAENIDQDFHLQYGITVDIAFMDLEPHKALFAAWPRFTLATTTPGVDSLDFAIGYHYGGAFKQKEIEDEFKASPKPPLPGELYFADVRSVSLGKVKTVGTGLITDVSTMEVMSSGSPKIFFEGGEPRVFGISVGSYYDQPINSFPDWTLIQPINNIIIDVQLPEPGRSNVAAPRNRNVILGLHHSCIKAMLDKI